MTLSTPKQQPKQLTVNTILSNRVSKLSRLCEYLGYAITTLSSVSGFCSLAVSIDTDSEAGVELLMWKR